MNISASTARIADQAPLRAQAQHARRTPRQSLMENIKLLSVRRDHGRAALTLSNGETLVMPRAMLKERPYRGGTPFDREAFDAFLSERSYPFAMEKAVALLAMRPRTQQEIADALRKNAYPARTIARVMARLDEAGYINDTNFAEQWAASRTGKGMGARRIRMELRRKGVDGDAIDEALSSIDEDEMLSGALKAARKAASRKDISDPKDRQKVLAALARRGYGYSEAKQALDMLKERSE